MTWQGIVSLCLGTVLIDNFVFVRFLGVCPFLSAERKPETAPALCLSQMFMMTAAAAAIWPIGYFLPDGMGHLRTVIFVLTAASLASLYDMVLKRLFPAVHAALGVYLPLVTLNCAVMGAVLLNSNRHTGFLESVLFAFFAALGFALAVFLFSSVRERLEHSDIPKMFEGFPIALVTAGLIAMAFMGL